MRIEIDAPDIPLAQICEAVEYFADYLGLKEHYNGSDTILCHGAQTIEKAKPIVAISAGNSEDRAARAKQTLRRILPYAPKGAVLATDGRRYGILPRLAQGWREVQP